jgi:hypothetical protein
MKNRLMLRFCWISLLCFAAMLAGCSAGEDYSTPRNAVKSLYAALVAGSVSSARGAVCNEEQQAVIEEMKALIVGVLAAQDAATARFGSSGASVFGGLPSMDDIDQAIECIQGDTATLAIKNSEKQIQLKKISGQWKVDLFSVLGLTPDSTEKAKRAITSAGKAATAVAKRIKEGQFNSLKAADEALQWQMKLAVASELIPAKFGI